MVEADRQQRWETAMRAERHGDGAAYAAFLRELAATLRPAVRARSRRLGLNAAAAEDVVQEILIAVHDRRRQWDERRPLQPWLNAIAHYKAIDAVRREGRETKRRATLSDDEWARLADPAATVALPEPDVERLVDALPPLQRSVVRALAMGNDGSQADAARQLGISPGSVRVTFHRALKRLRIAAGREHQG